MRIRDVGYLTSNPVVRLLKLQIFLLFAVFAELHSAGEKHWAFQPIKSSTHMALDALVEVKLKENGLTFSPEEKPERLLRRVYLNLIGLPPTPIEIKEWVKDPSEENLSGIVDDLLSRPQYGERWGRHWLDLARYADSNGLHEDHDRPNAWRYRDYVIESLNNDKPYSQFIKEQIAGDELAPEDVQSWIATGFCRNGPSNEENVAKNEIDAYRLDQLDDVIATTTQVFLGQTIACARCHDHKTEPFLQKDYYRMLAIFDTGDPTFVPIQKNGTLGKPILQPTKPRDRRKPPKEPHARAFSDYGKKPRVTHLLLRGNHTTPADEVNPGIPVVLNTLPSDFTISTPSESAIGRRLALANWIAAPENALTWRVIANRIWQFHFGAGIVETASDFGVSGTPPTHPELLDWLAAELLKNEGRLKQLHKTILLSRTFRQSSSYRENAAKIDPQTRYLWRFPPHRLEAEVIRDSILSASGKLNLKAGGKGIKPRVPFEILEQSKRNQWPKVEKETAEHWRRSVYIYIKRQLPMPMLTLFDAPDTSQTCSVRFRSTTPTQSLTLLNDAFTNEQARYLAQRILKEQRDASDAIKQVHLRIFALPLDDQALGKAMDFMNARIAAHKGKKNPQEDALTDLAVVWFNSSQFVYVD